MSLVPILCALGAAAAFGITGQLQHRATHSVAPGGSPWRVAVGLVHSPLWVFSVLGSVIGIALQALALATGPIILVQPLLVTGVLFAAVTGIAMTRRSPDWPFMSGLLLACAGLAGFLIAARPTAGSGRLTFGTFLPLAIGLGVLLAVLVAAGYRARGTRRQLTLALAAGVDYGLTAGVIKVLLDQLPGGLGAVLTSWSLYALVVVGPLGFLLNQEAYREGQLASPALAVITVTDPLVGIGIGLLWLGESVRVGGGLIVAEVVSLAVLAAGVFLVAHRAPIVAQETERDAIDVGDREPDRAKARQGRQATGEPG